MITSEQTIFLSNLNKALKQIEQEIIDRAKICLEIAENKLKERDPFTTDYEVEATIYYYGKDKENPIHVYTRSFNYDSIIVKQDYGLLLDYLTGADWRDEVMPALNEPYCYLLHDLFDHLNMRKIYGIKRIWVDVCYRDQKLIKVFKDGTPKK